MSGQSIGDANDAIHEKKLQGEIMKTYVDKIIDELNKDVLVEGKRAAAERIAEIDRWTKVEDGLPKLFNEAGCSDIMVVRYEINGAVLYKEAFYCAQSRCWREGPNITRINGVVTHYHTPPGRG